MLSAVEFQKITNVSRGTMADFEGWRGLLERWNSRINLVSSGAMEDFWGRHALDSCQLWSFVPESARTFLDFGSGAGFPGIAMAIRCKEIGQGEVTLVESAGKKANFLRTVIRELDLPATVWADRAEKLPPKPYDVITARAFAPLPKLLTYAQPFWAQHTTALLLKGQTVDAELTQAQKQWTFDVEKTTSRSDETGCVLRITGLKSLEV